MKPLIAESLETLLQDSSFTKKYYYIAHLLDRVLLGKEKEGSHNTLVQAARDGQVLELHLFNEEKEIFISRVDGKFIKYNPLFHEYEQQKRRVITRCYELMPSLLKANGVANYSGLEVKEYVSYDENHMAYVEKTVLYRFIEGRKE